MLATIIGPQMDTSSAWCKAPDDEPLGKQVSRMLFELTGRMRAHLAAVADAVELTPMQARWCSALACTTWPSPARWVRWPPGCTVIGPT